MHASPAIPEALIGPGALSALGARAAAFGQRALLVADPAIGAATAQALAALRAAGVTTVLYDGLRGEPTAAAIAEAAALAQGAQVVIGLGGGSAIDAAKAAALCAASGEDAEAYAACARPLPPRLALIAIPTTAGAGAEASATAVFTTRAGAKTWLWGPQARPDLAILDPSLAVSLPPALTAWCGMDALVHAFEAATNRNASPASAWRAHAALALIVHALPRAVADGADSAARADMAWAAFLAGAAIDCAGTAAAHMVSHALASLAPVNHGLATALAFEATLPWLVKADTPAMTAAARALGAPDTAALPACVTALMDRCGVVRALPPAFATVTPQALAQAMAQPQNAPMRAASARPVDDAALAAMAAQMLALAPVAA